MFTGVLNVREDLRATQTTHRLRCDNSKRLIEGWFPPSKSEHHRKICKSPEMKPSAYFSNRHTHSQESIQLFSLILEGPNKFRRTGKPRREQFPGSGFLGGGRGSGTGGFFCCHPIPVHTCPHTPPSITTTVVEPELRPSLSSAPGKRLRQGVRGLVALG